MLIPPKQFVEDILGMEFREDEVEDIVREDFDPNEEGAKPTDKGFGGKKKPKAPPPPSR